MISGEVCKNVIQKIEYIIDSECDARLWPLDDANLNFHKSGFKARKRHK